MKKCFFAALLALALVLILASCVNDKKGPTENDTTGNSSDATEYLKGPTEEINLSE